MNSIEFIEELINNIETNIYITESVLKTYDEDSDDEEEINTLKNNLEYLKERLKYSKQIKTELEAFEIVKEKLKLSVETEEATTEGFCMKGYWLVQENFKKVYPTIIEKEQYEKLKKALEVKDE